MLPVGAPCTARSNYAFLHARQSCPSIASAPATLVSPQCFLPGTTFLDIHNKPVRVEDLHVGDSLQGLDGPVQILSLAPCPKVDRDVVNVCTSAGTFVVTSSHRLCILVDDSVKTTTAGSLPQRGLNLSTPFGPTAFETRLHTQSTPVYEMRFSQDMSVQMLPVWHSPAACIVAKGATSSDQPFSSFGGTWCDIESTSLSPRSCQSAPPEVGDYSEPAAASGHTHCQIRLNGRSHQDPTVWELLVDLCSNAGCTHLIEPYTPSPENRHVVVLPLGVASDIEHRIESVYQSWRRLQAAVRQGRGGMSRAPRLQFQQNST